MRRRKGKEERESLVQMTASDTAVMDYADTDRETAFSRDLLLPLLLLLLSSPLRGLLRFGGAHASIDNVGRADARPTGTPR